MKQIIFFLLLTPMLFSCGDDAKDDPMPDYTFSDLQGVWVKVQDQGLGEYNFINETSAALTTAPIDVNNPTTTNIIITRMEVTGSQFSFDSYPDYNTVEDQFLTEGDFIDANTIEMGAVSTGLRSIYKRD